MRNQLGKNDDEDDELEDEVHLHYPLDYALETWQEHRLHHTYPAPGGYDDQDAFLMKDWHVINLRVSYFYGLYKDKKEPLDLGNLNKIPGAIEEPLF